MTYSADVAWQENPKLAVIVGKTSDIGRALGERLQADHWEVVYKHANEWHINPHWDLLIICTGMLEPIGRFPEVDILQWADGVEVNGLLPLRVLHYCYAQRRENASVCFFGGPNLSKPSPTYSAYRAGKVLLTDMVGVLNEETNLNVFMINPGVVKTKIHQQTMRAGSRAANYDRVAGMMNGEEKTTTVNEVYECLKWCIQNTPRRAVHVGEHEWASQQ